MKNKNEPSGCLPNIKLYFYNGTNFEWYFDTYWWVKLNNHRGNVDCVLITYLWFVLLLVIDVEKGYFWLIDNNE